MAKDTLYQMKCGAKQRKKDARCGQPAMPNGKCRLHGGLTPRGPASATFKHGRYSKSLASSAAATYQEALADAEILSVKDEAALLETAIHEALRRGALGGSDELWADLRERWSALYAMKGQEKADALNAIGDLIIRGASESAITRELERLCLSKVKVAEAERRRLIEMRHVITAEQMVALVGALVAIINEEVHDRNARVRIANGIDRALRGNAGGGSSAEH